MKTEATKQKIQKTLFSLSQIMPVKKITVSNLCQACQISRSTFYLHYDNVDDLTDYLEKDLLYRIEKILKQEQYIPFENLQNRTFYDLLNYIESRKQEFLFLTSKELGYDFISKVSIVIEKLLTNRLQYLGFLIDDYDMAIKFCSSGILKLLITQIKNQQLTDYNKTCYAYNNLLLTIFKYTSLKEQR